MLVLMHWQSLLHRPWVTPHASHLAFNLLDGCHGLNIHTPLHCSVEAKIREEALRMGI